MKKLASNQFLKWSNIKERKRKKKLKEMKLKEKKTMDEGENSEVARMGRTEHLYIAVGASRP